MHIELDVLMVGKRLTDKRESDLANQALHQTPDTWAVPARAGGGAGEHKHTISWKVKIVREVNVGSGVCFYQLNVGDQIETKKMVLIR